MYSGEKQRFAAFSKDLRWRMVHQAVELNKSYRQVVLALNVDISTVQRTLCLFARTGGIQKRKYPPNFEFAKVRITYFLSH